MYLLDTNVISELRRPRPNRAVLAWLSGVSPEQLFIAAVTFGELQAGVEMTRRQDPVKAAAIERWIDSVAASYSVLPIDEVIFRRWARLMHRKIRRSYRGCHDRGDRAGTELDGGDAKLDRFRAVCGDRLGSFSVAGVINRNTIAVASATNEQFP
jgi:toxin FitB